MLQVKELRNTLLEREEKEVTVYARKSLECCSSGCGESAVERLLADVGGRRKGKKGNQQTR